MANDEILTDDSIAELLAKEANEYSLRYSSMGLEAYRDSKPANKAKPNTRFLRQIIRETKNHNEALLAKEAAESQARLNDLAGAEQRRQRRLNPEAQDVRRRQLGDITAILQGKKKRRGSDESRQQSSSLGSREGRRHGAGGRHANVDVKSLPSEQNSTRDRTSERQHRHHLDEEYTDGERKRRRSRDRHRSRSPDYRERSHRSRHRSPLDDDRRSSRRSRRHSKRAIGGGEDEAPRSSQRKEQRVGDDSDPLEDIIGPQPATRTAARPKGRGMALGSSAMDGRFSDSYDPKTDVQPDPDTAEDWDEALEALRDRQKWKQQGAERLRATGFTEEQITRWERGGERGIQDVRWSVAGEAREWDRGKTSAPW